MRLPYRFGRYTLVERIASGGTAEVYRAVLAAEEGFAKTVAVKRLLPSWGGDSEVERMLIDEARALTHLQHQAIVQVLELGRSEGMPFIAMEFVDGIDCARLLADIVRDGTPLPTALALYVASQVLTALEFAHRSVDGSGRRLGIVHRDISPSNILLSWNGEVKVTDFGIAKGLHRTRETAIGGLKGKYAYMAPEQASGLAIDARADLFACGICLCELLTARRLFDAPTDADILESVKGCRLPEGLLDGLPAGMRAILILSLAPEAPRRYQSAAEMLSDVTRFAKSSGELASSLDLARFLRERYGPPDRLSPEAPVPEAGRRTLVADAAPVSKSGRSRAARFARAAGTAAFLGLALFIQPAPQHRYEAGAIDPAPSLVLPRGDGAETPAPSLLPEARGAIALDSSPTGATGTLVIGGIARQIKTPFTLDGIEMGEGLEGKAEIGAPGYETDVQEFRLIPAAPTFARSVVLKREGLAILSVSARPWGLVDIPGYTAGRETPLAGLKLKAGAYQVRVRHPPSGRAAASNVVLVAGTSRHCLATFAERARMICR